MQMDFMRNYGYLPQRRNAIIADNLMHADEVSNAIKLMQVILIEIECQ
jgi:hypothetical protein